MLPYVFAGFAFFRIVYAIAIAKRQGITTVSQAQIEEFKPYTLYAAAAFCNPSNTLTWSCGGPYIMSRPPERLGADLLPSQLRGKPDFPAFGFRWRWVRGPILSVTSFHDHGLGNH